MNILTFMQKRNFVIPILGIDKVPFKEMPRGRFEEPEKGDLASAHR